MNREHFSSRLGFIMISAGCAIGLGNVWKFPYMVGSYGGGAFVLLYILFLVILGIPVLTVEFALGRGSQKSPAKMYNILEPHGSRWHIHGYACLAGVYLLMMFYTTVAGWMIYYFFRTVSGSLEGLDAEGVGAAFGGMCADPAIMTCFMAVVVFIGFFVCSFSLQKGLERVTKYIMAALLVLILILAFHGLTLDGAGAGMEFYLKPDISKMTEVGIGTVTVKAMSQAFFTLGLGTGSMAIFGSYIGRDRTLLGESVSVTALDTFIAIVSGIIIFPACFTFGVEPTSGPGLVFVTLPNIFNSMAGGRIIGGLFFAFMSCAALSTVFAVFECIVACTMDYTGWSRKKTCTVSGVIMFALSMPCLLGFNVFSGFQPLGEGSTVLDLEDFILSNILLPIGAVVFILFCTTKKGWGLSAFIEEANAGKGLKIQPWMTGYIRYVLPVIVTAVFVIGLISYFS